MSIFCPSSAWIFAGVVLIGLGSILTTMGWNHRSQEKQNRNVISSLVNELLINGRIQQSDLEIIKHWPSRTENENFSPQPFRTNHLTNTITSGLFNRSKPTDLKILNTLESYEQALAEFNSGLHIVGRLTPGMFIKPDLIGDANAWPNDYQQALSERFRNLLKLHSDAENALRERYHWAFTTSP